MFNHFDICFVSNIRLYVVLEKHHSLQIKTVRYKQYIN